MYNSTRWRELRKSVLKRDRYLCTNCGTSVRGLGKSRVDHIKTAKHHPELFWDMKNLRTLCPACDNARHSEKGKGRSDETERMRQTGLDGLPSDPDHPFNRR